MSKILVVDDEIQYAEVLSESLQLLGHQITTCSNAKDALGVLTHNDIDSKYDLILSDIKMPEMMGVDFYKTYKNLPNSNAKFILMTGNADLLSVKNAFELGVDELLAKPFNQEILELVLDYLLDLHPENHSNEKFFQIPIKDFMVSSHSEYYLYLKIAGKYVCVSKTGQEFTKERLAHYVSKDVKYVYLTASDFAKYTDLQFAISDTVKLRPLDNAKKVKAYRHLISTVSQNAIVNQMEKDGLQKALTAFENYTQVAFNNQQMSEMLVSFFTELPDFADRNAMVAVISSCLAESWHWSSAKTQSRIVLGAMVCDLGLKDNPELLTKKKFEFTREELQIYENHPFKGFQLLSDLGGVPDEVLQITLQHHENGIAAGFPQKLLRQNIHSFAKLIHGVQEFVSVLLHQENKNDVKAAIDHLFLFQRKIVSEQVIKSLYKIFNLDVPKELETLLLPDRSGRLN